MTKQERQMIIDWVTPKDGWLVEIIDTIDMCKLTWEQRWALDIELVNQAFIRHEYGIRLKRTKKKPKTHYTMKQLFEEALSKEKQDDILHFYSLIPDVNMVANLARLPAERVRKFLEKQGLLPSIPENNSSV